MTSSPSPENTLIVTGVPEKEERRETNKPDESIKRDHNMYEIATQHARRVNSTRGGHVGVHRTLHDIELN